MVIEIEMGVKDDAEVSHAGTSFQARFSYFIRKEDKVDCSLGEAAGDTLLHVESQMIFLYVFI